MKSKIKYENRYVLFLDILGFKKLIQDTETDLTQDKANDLYSALSIIQGFKIGEAIIPRNVTQFSDSIVISFNDDNKLELIHLFDEIIGLLMEMIGRGIVFRGAISYGKFFHDNKILFGPALVDAYEAETNAAIYPRVILDKSIIRIFKETKTINNPFPLNYIDQFLKVDFDDRCYIDYFEYPFTKAENLKEYIDYMEKLRMLIHTENGNAKTADIKIKYGWMKNKFNDALKKTSKKDLNKLFGNHNSDLIDLFNKIKPLK